MVFFAVAIRGDQSLLQYSATIAIRDAGCQDISTEIPSRYLS